MIQWLSLGTSSSGCPGSIPGPGTRSHMPQRGAAAKIQFSKTKKYLKTQQNTEGLCTQMGYFTPCSGNNNGNQFRSLPLPFNSFFIKKKKKKKGLFFIYFWLHWVFVVACRLSLVAHELLKWWHTGSVTVVGRLPQLQHESLGAQRYVGS